MASLARRLVSCFLIVALISSLHIEAREGKFFTKDSTSAPALAPSISTTPAPSPLPIEGGFGFAPGPAEAETETHSTEFPAKKTTTTTTDNKERDEILEDEIASEKLGEYDTPTGNNHQYSNNNERYSNNYYYNTNGYSNSGYEYYNKAGTGNNGYINYDNGYENNEQKGMSDTRFLENGKYYYDMNNKENRSDPAGKMTGNGYGSGEENGYSTEGRDNGYRSGYGEKSKYEFDTMEEYERQQGYPDTDKLYYNP